MDQASQSFSFTGGMINTQLMILRGDSSHNKQGVFKYLKHVDLVLENDHADSNYFDILYTLTEMEFIKHKDIHVQLWVGICFQKLLARLRSKTDHCDKEKLQLILEFLIDNTKGVNSSNESLYKYSLLFVERLSSAETLCTCSSLPDAAVTNISCILFYTAFQLINENNWISIFSSLLNILVRFAHQVLSLHDVTPVLDIIYVNIIKPSRKERPFVAKFTSNLILACAHILELPTQEFLQSCLVGKILPKDSLVSEGKLDLIGQLHKICPWLVATVWGPLRNILKERDSPDRPQTLLLLAKMFCKSQSNYITQHYSTWRVFLDSLLIGSASDNALVVQFAKEFLSVQQNKCMQKQFIELYLVPVVNRGDENLVLDGMSAIVELLQTNTQLFTENTDLLEILVTVSREGKEGVICELEERILPIVVPAILEHEAVPSLRGEIESTVDIQKIFYFICANSLNKLLLSKELCNWSKGIHIRYNLSYLEMWVRDHLTQNTNVLDTLQPMIQAAHLLQANKQTENDAKHICDTCDKLSMAQITKILNLFASAEDLEPVLVAFIRKVQTALHERTELQEQTTLIMDTYFHFPLQLPFKPSKIRLEDLEVPEELNLPMLEKV